jgi:hypothetical protein
MGYHRDTFYEVLTAGLRTTTSRENQHQCEKPA